MSLFSKKDYAREATNQTVYQTKVKLPTNMRTKKIKCSLCKNQAIQIVQISDKETRKLCKFCLVKYLVGNEKKNKVVFVKASELD